MLRVFFVNLFVLTVLFVFHLTNVPAAAFTVTKTADTNDGVCDSDCSLREAVAAATDSSNARIVDFSAALTGSTIILTNGEITLNKVKVIGFGAKYLTISGNNNSRIFLVTSGSGTMISGLTLAGGNGVGAPGGGDAGGGAVRVLSGGAVLDGLNITFNGAAGLGGGVFFENGSNTIRNSTFSQNTAQGGFGSAVWSAFGTSAINNSTFALGNDIGIGKGTIVVRNITAPVEVYLRNNPSSFGFGNSIIGHIRVELAAGIAVSAGNNIIMNTAGSAGVVGFMPSDRQNVDPLLGPLADFGGKTPTMPLLTGSAAIDAGSNSLAAAAGLLYDERRYTRVADGNGDSKAVVDIGAYENLGIPANNTSVGGTVSDGAGVPVSRALVTLTDMDGHTQAVLTNPFGFYQFFNVAVGEVNISVEAKAHRSSPVVSQAVEGQANTVNITVQ